MLVIKSRHILFRPVQCRMFSSKLDEAYVAKYPLHFDPKGDMFLYECSRKSKKLKAYQYIPRVLGLPLTYLTLTSWYGLFTGFGLWPLGKVFLSSVGLFSVIGINGNL